MPVEIALRRAGTWPRHSSDRAPPGSELAASSQRAMASSWRRPAFVDLLAIERGQDTSVAAGTSDRARSRAGSARALSAFASGVDLVQLLAGEQSKLVRLQIPGRLAGPVANWSRRRRAPSSELPIRSAKLVLDRDSPPAAGRSARTRSAGRWRRRPGPRWRSSRSAVALEAAFDDVADAEFLADARAGRAARRGRRSVVPRAITFQPSPVRSPMTFSIMPSASRPRRASPDRFSSGRTAIERAGCGATGVHGHSHHDEAGEQDQTPAPPPRPQPTPPEWPAGGAPALPSSRTR